MTIPADPRHAEPRSVTLPLVEWRNLLFMLSLFKRTLELAKQAPGAISQVEAAIATLRADEGLVRRLTEVGLLKEKPGGGDN